MIQFFIDKLVRPIQGPSSSFTLIEASFILTSKEWKEIYNSSKRKMENGLGECDL